MKKLFAFLVLGLGTLLVINNRRYKKMVSNKKNKKVKEGTTMKKY